ncbi:MAG: type II secretion system major pseudopilin GspG [Desulfamplus sp.]
MKKTYFGKCILQESNCGFTLIELMVVVVILGILASLIVPRLMGRTDEARVIKAKVDISAIETALKLYRLHNGNYPSTEQGLRALIEEPTTEPLPRRWDKNGYLEKKSIPKDPWDREYIYLSPGVHDEYDIISYGADGAPEGEGNDADIKSWELE